MMKFPIKRLPFIAVALLAVSIQAMAIEIVCHRGANGMAPENTFAAAQLCVDWGMEYVEIDVRTSRDGVMYILHDRTVNRTTDGGDVPIRELTSEEVDRLDAGSWFDPRFEGERVPRLDEFLRWAKGKIKVYLDVKDADLNALIGLIRETEFEDDCFFWFGNPSMAREFHRLAPDLPLKINAGTPELARKAKEEFNAAIIETGLENITPELRDVCRELDIRVMVNVIGDGGEEYREAVRLGVDMANLDRGNAFRRIEREMQGVRPIDIRNRESYEGRLPVLILHRGGVIAPDAPECSLRAIYRAARAGYEMVELDVRESRDGAPVYFHDEEMMEDCGVEGRIEDKTLEEIRVIHYTDSDQHIATLDEALAACRDFALGVMLDIKGDGSEAFFQKIAELTERYGLGGSTVCISRHPLAFKHLGGLSLMPLSEEETHAAAEGKNVDAEGKFWFGWPRYIENGRVKALMDRGIQVIPSINTFHYPPGSPYSAEADIRRMKEAGVEIYQIDSVYGHYFGIGEDAGTR